MKIEKARTEFRIQKGGVTAKRAEVTFTRPGGPHISGFVRVYANIFANFEKNVFSSWCDVANGTDAGADGKRRAISGRFEPLLTG